MTRADIWTAGFVPANIALPTITFRTASQTGAMNTPIEVPIGDGLATWKVGYNWMLNDIPKIVLLPSIQHWVHRRLSQFGKSAYYILFCKENERIFARLYDLALLNNAMVRFELGQSCLLSCLNRGFDLLL